MNEIFETWNAAPEAEAMQAILPCNGSRAWATAMAQQRPFPHTGDLFAAADAVWSSLSADAWQEAFDSHPRLGERHAKAASRASLAWSAGEQHAISAEEELAADLARANCRYEERFGRIFIVCATGRSGAEVLAILQHRLQNDPEAELRETAEQQRRITQLRLRKWLGQPAVRCEDV